MLQLLPNEEVKEGLVEEYDKMYLLNKITMQSCIESTSTYQGG
jgi:hypothetical protein